MPFTLPNTTIKPRNRAENSDEQQNLIFISVNHFSQSIQHKLNTDKPYICMWKQGDHMQFYAKQNDFLTVTKLRAITP